MSDWQAPPCPAQQGLHPEALSLVLYTATWESQDLALAYFSLVTQLTFPSQGQDHPLAAGMRSGACGHSVEFIELS